MQNDLPPNRLPNGSRRKISFSFDGKTLSAFQGDSVAAALIGAGQVVTRATPVSGTARGPYCMMGVCFDCLVQIDGVSNQQACMHEVREGMMVEPQDGAYDARDTNLSGTTS